MGRTSTAFGKLVDAAAALFYERGYHSVGVSEICAAAGVQKGSFYHFFDSKRALALAVIEAYAKEMEDELEELQPGHGTPLERLRSFLAGLHERLHAECQNGSTLQGCPLGNLALELATQDSELRDALKTGFDAQLAAFESLLREAREQGEIPPDIAPAEAALSLVALLEGKLLFAKLLNDADPLAGVETEALRLLGAGAAS